MRPISKNDDTRHFSPFVSFLYSASEEWGISGKIVEDDPEYMLFEFSNKKFLLLIFVDNNREMTTSLSRSLKDSTDEIIDFLEMNEEIRDNVKQSLILDTFVKYSDNK